MRWHMVRTFKTAAWLGWQVESNWTDPFFFLVFSVLKPVASVLILVVMYRLVSQAGAGSPIYAYIYLGNAFYIYVGSMVAGASYAILDDREHYRTLKYLYVAPISIPVYLMGRAVAKFIIGSMAVSITLLAGVVFFNVPLNFAAADWPLFGVTLALGLACLTFMGISFGMWTLTLQNEPWMLGESVAAALYLFSGAIFPITILPAFLQPIGFALPITYWLELLRRALLGAGAAAFPTLAAFSTPALLAILSGLTVAFGLVAALAFRRFDHVARERGMIDLTSNF
jgi:ABC-2 type transport system permease protein